MIKLLISTVLLLSSLANAADFTITVQPASGSGANSSLSNISSTSIPSSLVPNGNVDLGSYDNPWNMAWIKGFYVPSNGVSLYPNGNLSMNLNKIYNLPAPVDAGDAATKAYVDSKLSSNIEVKYTISANERTITNGGGIIPFGHMKLDNRSAYNSSTGIFTAPSDGGGLYLVTSNMFTSATLNSSTSWYFSAIKIALADSSTEVIAFDNKAGTGAPNTNNAVKLSGIVRLLPGDTIHIESSLDTASSLVINQNYNQLSIVRISQ